MRKRKGTKKTKESLSSKTVKNLGYNFLSLVINRIFSLIFAIIVARTLFPELFGIYSLALAIILTILTFTDLGLGATLGRYVAESIAKKTKKSKIEARSRARFLLNLKILLTAIFALLIFTLSNVLAVYVFKKPLLALPLQLGALYIIITSFHSFFQTIFIAVQKIKFNAIGELISQVLRIAFVLVFFLFFKTVSMIFISLILSIFVSLLFLYIVFSKKYSFLLRGKRIPIERKRILKFFGFLTISGISFVIFLHIDVFMLGFFLPSEFVGFYSAIFSITVTVAAVFIGFGNVLLPVFTQLKDSERFRRGFKKVFHYSMLLAIPAVIGIAYVAIPMLQIIYGQAYVPLQYKLTLIITAAILSLLIIESGLSSFYITLFSSKELTRFPAFIMLISAVINIILNFILVSTLIGIKPEYGLIGAAIATIVSRYFNLSVLTVRANKKLKVKPDGMSVFKPIIASLFMLAFLFAFDYFVPLNLLRGIIMIVAAIFVYFLFLRIFRGINKEDIKVLKLLRS